MKKRLFFFKWCITSFLIMLLLGIVACSNNSKSVPQDDENNCENSQSLNFKVIKQEIPCPRELKGETTYNASVEYPTSGPKVLVDNIRDWINQTTYEAWKDDNEWYGIDEEYISIYSGNLEEGEALVSHYLNAEANVSQWDRIRLNFSKVYETDKYVSMTAGLYRACADFVDNNNCATFKKKDGKRLSAKKLFEKFDKKTKEVIWRYKDDDFSWLCPESVHEIDFSGMDVCLQGDSIRFFIPNTPYRGSGTIIVPTSSLEMYLSKDVKTLLK